MYLKSGIGLFTACAVVFGVVSYAQAQVDIRIIPQTVTITRDSGLTSTEIQKILNLGRSFGYSPKQIAELNDLLIRKKITFKPADASVLVQDLQLGAVGEDVRALQKFLNSNGMPITSSGPGSFGKESTHFGTLTQKALVKFQQAVGLPATGVLDAKTRNLITGH